MKLILVLTLIGVVAAQLSKDIEFDITDNVIAQLPSNDAYIACTSEKYNYCQAEFNTYLNYNGKWTDAALFQHAINLFYKQDVSGLLNLCHGRQKLFRCFGTEYDSCTSRFQFLRLGVNVSTAYQVSGIFNSLDFECSGGSVQATQNWQCIWTVWQSKNYLDAKKACMAAFYSNTFNTPNDVCIAGQGLAVCLSQQFIAAAAPCNINDLVWFECQRIVDFFQFDGNCPNIRCQVKGSSFASQPQSVEESFQRKLSHNDGLAAIHKAHKRPDRL